jgi:hypothetical protein
MLRVVLIGVLACSACSDDSSHTPWILDDLTGDQGISVRTPEFEVPRGTEVQDCYFFDVPDAASGDDMWIDRIQLALNEGSHHMNLFRVKTIVSLDPAAGEPVDMGNGITGTVIRGADSMECWRSSNWADWPLVANSQQSAYEAPILDWQLPDGVAMRLSPGEKLMLQVHYANRGDQETPWVGRGGVNMYFSHDNDTMELGTLFASQQSIRVCRSNPTPSYSGACALPAGSYTATAANGHFHSRGTEFRMWSWDGVSTTRPDDSALFYDNTSWSEPKMSTGLDVALPPDGGIWWTCDFRWSEPEGGCEAVDERDPEHANDCCYTFGPIVETSEHCNAFLYYYPRTTEHVTCF